MSSRKQENIPKKWLHLTTNYKDGWVIPIWNAINKAESEGLCSGINKNMSELALHIETRLNMLSVIKKRIGFERNCLIAKTQGFKDENIFERDKEGRGMLVPSVYVDELLVDIDSFLFETNSCCELMQKFLGEIYNHCGKPIEKKLGGILAKILRKQGQNIGWYRLLDRERNFLIHDGAPYIAIDISTDKPDILIMKENIRSFDDPNKFVRLSELESIAPGFDDAKVALQQYIVNLYSSNVAS